VIRMPRLDTTGPFGAGPMTGRGLGPCGRGFGKGMGYGCLGRNYFSRSEEKDVLTENIKDLEADLQAAKERLTEIESK
jgi:hypothetical protein